MSPTNINRLLKVIQSGDVEELYIHITKKALEWAICGFTEEANQLLGVLWGYNFKHSEQLRSVEQGLQVFWQASRTTPANVPFPFIDIDEIEKENWNGVIYQSSSAVYNTSIKQLTGGHLLATAITAGATQVLPTAAIVEALDRFLQSNEAVGYSYYHATTAACLLAGRSHLSDELEKYIKLWGQGYLKYWSNYDLAVLLKERSIISLLLEGILAPVFNLSSASIKKDLETLKLALMERAKNGKTLLYSQMPWMELLTKISSIVASQHIDAPSAEIKDAGWLGKAGTSEQNIQNVEQRLNIRFPEDYREFLCTSNGFDSITPVSPTVAPVEYVDYFTSYDAEFVESWIYEVMQENETLGCRFRQSIVIGGQGEEQQLLLVPDEIGAWECWFFATWASGETRYPSFRFYMESQLKDLEENITI
ncbi:SMI1/KNR4 family protein [Flavisolibacter tropicus]|uniref:Knr4/Smi1-like domain-containing protein n=1 Tax=Flavisolibacter tropicus TaxID=1492898 RepID=A0A172TX08_9BACT|nr:SMI1/KNR4 family protein [Flavisolibacter tropicus]ANE51323.1 hypothetical protein SY85_13180 [Flavisolibacter tropicus]